MGTPESSRPARLRVGVVGAGRVGSTLGAALARSGHEITGVVAVSASSRERAERLLPQAPVLPMDEVVAGADLVLLAVPDDALRPLVAGLADTGSWHTGQLVAHTSGAQGIGVLDPAAARGVIPLALHPVMTFVGRPEDLDRLDGAPFGVTADDDLRPVAESLVLEMGGEPVWVPEPARPLYHAALSVGSNHLVTLIADALALLDGAGVERSDQLLAPLVSAALDNALRLRDAALTGPVSRGDVATVAAHLRTLQAAAPDALPSYRAMARRTAERARDAGRLDAEQFAAVIEVLDA
ncbi:MAG TPA: DUF2520 domain-containing protein [Jatrophihabitantaceae bacterium]|nr:DUF2520 domain-containing protein [Jatrophihabitantaceae bacterium]